MDDSKIKYKFFVGQLKYEGFILSTTETHYVIYDTFKCKEFKLPIANTVLEEIS